MTIVLNERKYAEELLGERLLPAKPTEAFGRLTRYYKAEGHTKGEVHRLLEDWLLHCDPSANLVKW